MKTTNQDSSKLSDLIDGIKINKANLEHILETGKINGTLLTEITRVVNEHMESRTINIDKDKMRIEFDEYMMLGMKQFNPDNVFDWLFHKLESFGASVNYPSQNGL